MRGEGREGRREREEENKNTIPMQSKGRTVDVKRLVHKEDQRCIATPEVQWISDVQGINVEIYILHKSKTQHKQTNEQIIE